MTLDLSSHFGLLPQDLGEALASTYRDVMDHFLKMEWDDAQVDAGRLCEAMLRYLEWKMSGAYTPIDGKSKPKRKPVVGRAANDTNLAPSLRAQMPQAIELILDFRNNRNSAHLGNIDANKLDASTVVANATWLVAEVVRLETKKPPAEVQALIDRLTERHVPLIQTVQGEPILLTPGLGANERALVVLYQQAKPVQMQQLREWVGYSNSSRWRTSVISNLRRKAFVHVDKEDNVTPLVPGEAEAQRIVLAAGGL